MEKFCIYGTGGFGREVLCLIKDIHKYTLLDIKEKVVFMVDSEFYASNEIMGCKCIKSKDFDPINYKTIVAVADPKARSKMVEKLPLETNYPILIHPSAIVSDWVEIHIGSIITAGCILTSNIKIGQHVHMNLKTTIGHDSILGNFCTTSPSVNISGNCVIGSKVFIGVGSSIKEKISICCDVTIGMGSIVIKDITQSGTYFGSPVNKVS